MCAAEACELLPATPSAIDLARIAVNKPDKVRNIVLKGAVANTLKDLLFPNCY